MTWCYPLVLCFVFVDLEEPFTPHKQESSSTMSWLTSVGEQTQWGQVKSHSLLNLIMITQSFSPPPPLSDMECDCCHRWTASFLNDSSNTRVKVWRAPCDWWIRRKHDNLSGSLGNSAELRLHSCFLATMFVSLIWFSLILAVVNESPVAWDESERSHRCAHSVCWFQEQCEFWARFWQGEVLSINPNLLH